MCVLALVYNEDFAESSSVSAALMVIFLAAMMLLKRNTLPK
jgi:hypothetical protein